jgi:hypothetical protein
MKRFPVAFAALLISGCASTAELRRNPHVQIIWAGTYLGNRISSERGTDGVIQHQLSNALLIKSTTKITARQGVRFGVQYRVSGVPDSTTVELRRVLRYPAPGAAIPSAKAPLPYDEIEVQCSAGIDCLTGYGLDQPWEVIPGKWTFEFWSGDRMVAEQSFTVEQQ